MSIVSKHPSPEYIPGSTSLLEYRQINAYLNSKLIKTTHKQPSSTKTKAS